MWPDHCVQGSFGCEYVDSLVRKNTDIEILKGQITDVESYSGFGSELENTGLTEKLHALGVKTVYCVGLAYDYCVGSTAESAANLGFETFIIDEATASVDIKSAECMHTRMEKAGVKVISESQL